MSDHALVAVTGLLNDLGAEARDVEAIRSMCVVVDQASQLVNDQSLSSKYNQINALIKDTLAMIESSYENFQNSPELFEIDQQEFSQRMQQMFQIVEKTHIAYDIDLPVKLKDMLKDLEDLKAHRNDVLYSINKMTHIDDLKTIFNQRAIHSDKPTVMSTLKKATELCDISLQIKTTVMTSLDLYAYQLEKINSYFNQIKVIHDDEPRRDLTPP